MQERPRANRFLRSPGRATCGQAKKACDLAVKGKFPKAVCREAGIPPAGPNRWEGFRGGDNDAAFAGRSFPQRKDLRRILGQ